MGPAYKVFFKPTSSLYQQKAAGRRLCLPGRTYLGLNPSGAAGKASISTGAWHVQKP
jgi:hypothetical protein